MLTKEETEKIYQERIDSESWHGPYTEEEIRIQKERRKKIEKYKRQLLTEEQQKK